MLRLTSRGFKILTKPLSKVPFHSQIQGNYLAGKYYFTTYKFNSEFNHKLASGKYYQVLGYPSETNVSALTDVEVKRQYLSMVKKYHSDGVVDPVQKLQNQEITKCIIQAFDKISSERIRSQIEKGIYDKIYKDEDEIAMNIYGKKFDEIKYDLFKEGNNEKRAEFMVELQKIRKDSKYYSYVKEKQNETSTETRNKNAAFFKSQNIYVHNASHYSSSGSSNNGFLKFAIPGVAVLAGLLFYYISQSSAKAEQESAQRSKTRHTLGHDKIKQIEKRTTELHEKKLSDLIDSFVEEMPPCLKYPQKEDPGQVEQLVDFTIGPDINLYEVSTNLLGKKQNLDQLKQVKSEQELKEKFGPLFSPFPLTKIKPNSQITLSLQAERCLQNIYIKVKDVAQQIEQKGKFTPPKVFFRYFGYVMFEIREKPLSLMNYKGTEYISLFDLFFDYYSPIPVKRHEYNEYVVGLNDEDMKMYGQVHINNRKIPERYIGKDDKVVVMRDDLVPNDEKRNIQIWHDFYRRYTTVWNRGISARITSY